MSEKSTEETRQNMAALLLRRLVSRARARAFNSTSVCEELETLFRESRKGVDEMSIEELQHDLQMNRMKYSQIVNTPNLEDAFRDMTPVERRVWDALATGFSRMHEFDQFWAEAPIEFKDVFFDYLVYFAEECEEAVRKVQNGVTHPQG